MSESPFITYGELYKILHEKYQATDDEINYWVNLERYGLTFPQRIFKTEMYRFYTANVVIPYASDIPSSEGYYIIGQQPVEYSFYLSPCANKYIPINHHRFVYVRDLSGKRNWVGNLRSDTNLYSDFPALDEAARAGLLRFYDDRTKDFTYKRDQAIPQLWINTKEGQDYLSDPTKFFLLQDIINIERLFFNRPREDCLKELGIEE